MSCTQQKSWLDSLHYPKTERYKDIKKALKFLKSIKIPLRESPPTEPHPKSFFQWVWIENGTIVYRKAKVDVGQLLHEAGHLALTPPSRRLLITPSKAPPGPSCGDLAVEAWNYYSAIAKPVLPVHGGDVRRANLWLDATKRLAKHWFTRLTFSGKHIKMEAC